MRVNAAFLRLDQPAFDRNRLNAEKLIDSSNLEQLSASDWTRVALERDQEKWNPVFRPITRPNKESRAGHRAGGGVSI
jgi:hypothetical protein